VRQLAGFFPATAYPDVLVGLGEPDDAAVFRLDAERALIQTTDFFTPIVDDPWTYGAIAAVNAMSDVYAMGGEVLFCLNIAGFPDTLDPAIVAQIFAGGAAKVREAGAAITGGHTLTSPEPFYGLCVTGIVHPEAIFTKGGARPGDRLFLTKPLGTGIITTAAKQTGPAEDVSHRLARQEMGKPDLDVRHLDEAIISMTRFNRAAARAAQKAQVRGATDITGFGLLGHACEMADAGGAGFDIRAAAVATLPGIRAYIDAGYVTGASKRNPTHFGHLVEFGPDVTPAQRTLLWEAETSGGLLVAVPGDKVDVFTASCRAQTQPCWEIGVVSAEPGVRVV
jgi:selenide,water dikinase